MQEFLLLERNVKQDTAYGYYLESFCNLFSSDGYNFAVALRRIDKIVISRNLENVHLQRNSGSQASSY